MYDLVRLISISNRKMKFFCSYFHLTNEGKKKEIN